MGRACAIVGLVLTMAGTLLAGLALWLDWRAHAGGEPLIPVVAKTRRWLVWWALRRPAVTHSVGASLTAQWRVSTAASGYAAPPSNAPVDVQMRFVRERITALEETIASQRREVDQNIDHVQTQAHAAAVESRVAIAAVEAKIREVATGSVRMELVGLMLVGVGSIISTTPAVFGW